MYVLGPTVAVRLDNTIGHVTVLRPANVFRHLDLPSTLSPRSANLTQHAPSVALYTNTVLGPAAAF